MKGILLQSLRLFKGQTFSFTQGLFLSFILLFLKFVILIQRAIFDLVMSDSLS